MKVNNIISPHETINTPIVLKFTFLHSSPNQFLALVSTIYNIVKHNADRQSIPESTIKELDEMIKPMLFMDRPFDPNNFLNVVNEIPISSNLRCCIISPLLNKPGCALLTMERLYFQPSDCILANGSQSGSGGSKAIYWDINKDVIAVARRYYGLKNNSLEIFLGDGGGSILLKFDTYKERELVINHLLSIESDIVCYTDYDFLRHVMNAWCIGEISNFEYLLVLNAASGRTYHDLSRYPVFPWVISDYTSSKLDLSNEKTFRDLSVPIGALDKKRLEYFLQRMEGIAADDDADNDVVTSGYNPNAPFLYGTHYSAPGYVLYYLVRIMPEHMLW